MLNDLLFQNNRSFALLPEFNVNKLSLKHLIGSKIQILCSTLHSLMLRPERASDMGGGGWLGEGLTEAEEERGRGGHSAAAGLWEQQPEEEEEEGKEEEEEESEREKQCGCSQQGHKHWEREEETRREEKVRFLLVFCPHLSDFNAFLLPVWTQGGRGCWSGVSVCVCVCFPFAFLRLPADGVLYVGRAEQSSVALQSDAERWRREKGGREGEERRGEEGWRAGVVLYRHEEVRMERKRRVNEEN